MMRAYDVRPLVGAVLCVGLLANVTAAFAQTKGGAKGTGRIGTLDVVAVFNEYQRQKDLTEEMNSIKGRIEQENQTRRARVEALQATVNSMSPTDPGAVAKTKELLKEQIEFKNWVDMIQADMQREIGLWTAKIYQEVIDATREIAEADGYDVVLYVDEFQPAGIDPDVVRDQIRQRKVIYANPNISVTQQVLDKLNTKYRAQPRSPMLQVGP